MATQLNPAAAGDPYEKPYQLLKAQPVATAPASFPLRKTIESHADVIAPLCPPGVNVETVMAQLWAVCQRTPQVAEATTQSLVIALCDAVQTGGIIGKDVYLLPFKNKRGQYEVSAALDYKFLASCIIQAGGARSIDAFTVYEGDHFRPVYGTTPHIEHWPEKTRGKITHFYAVAHIGAGLPAKFVVMTLAEVEVIRKRSKQWGPDKVTACPDWYGMARAVHRLGKLLPKRDNPMMRRVEAVMDSDARVEAAEEIPSVPVATVADDRPATVRPNGEDLSEDWEVVIDPDNRERLQDASDRVVNGKTLGLLRNSGLRSVLAWATKKLDEEGANDRLAAIADDCRLLLAARENGTLVEPTKEAA